MSKIARIIIYLFWHSEQVDLHILMTTWGYKKDLAGNIRENILQYSLKCIFKNAPLLWQFCRHSNIQQQQKSISHRAFNLTRSLRWHKKNYQYPEVRCITCRIPSCLWLALIMLCDNSDKSAWTLNWLANEKLLSVSWNLWTDDNASDSCLLPYLIIMILDTWILGQS